MNDTQMLNWLEYHFERHLGGGDAWNVEHDVHGGLPLREAIQKAVQISLDLNTYTGMAAFDEIASNELFADGLGRLYMKTSGDLATQIAGPPYADEGDRIFYAEAVVYVNPSLFWSKRDEQLKMFGDES